MKYIDLEGTTHFWFAANNTSGSGDDGASASFDVRQGGTGPTAPPIMSGTPSLLSHADYPAGAYEIAIAATAANGFLADQDYGIFCTLVVSAQNPTGFIGEFHTRRWTRVADIPSASQVVTAIKADAEWRRLIANVNGQFTFNPPTSFPGTGTLVLKDQSGVNTLLTITLQYDSNEFIISRTTLG